MQCSADVTTTISWGYAVYAVMQQYTHAQHQLSSSAQCTVLLYTLTLLMSWRAAEHCILLQYTAIYCTTCYCMLLYTLTCWHASHRIVTTLHAFGRIRCFSKMEQGAFTVTALCPNRDFNSRASQPHAVWCSICSICSMYTVLQWADVPGILGMLIVLQYTVLLQYTAISLLWLITSKLDSTAT